jgi:hypothetical protein
VAKIPDKTDSDKTDSDKTDSDKTKLEKQKDLKKTKSTGVYGMISNAWNTITTTLNKKMSYIKYENKEYTVTEIIWLNDILNYPIYTDLLEKYENYTEEEEERNATSGPNTIDEDIVTLFTELVEINKTNTNDLISTTLARQGTFDYRNINTINVIFQEIKEIVSKAEPNAQKIIIN